MVFTTTANAFDPEIVRQASEMWPDQQWPHWIAYDSSDQRKKTCNVPFYMPSSVRSLIRQMLARCPEGLTPDPSLHSGGMHSIWPGGFVERHLDCSAHPLMSWCRARNVILYLNSDFDGGELIVGDSGIRPTANRLVEFDCTDDSFHSVATVEAGCRKSLMVCYWYPCSEQQSRTKAVFA